MGFRTVIFLAVGWFSFSCGFAAPTFTSGASAYEGAAHLVGGTSAANSRVTVFMGSTCSGAEVGQAMAGTDGSWGLSMTMPLAETFELSAQARLGRNQSACSRPLQVTVFPGAAPPKPLPGTGGSRPEIRATGFPSPSREGDRLRLVGYAEQAGTLRLYGTSDCTGPVLAEGQAQTISTLSGRFELGHELTEAGSYVFSVDNVMNGATSECSEPSPPVKVDPSRGWTRSTRLEGKRWMAFDDTGATFSLEMTATLLTARRHWDGFWSGPAELAAFDAGSPPAAITLLATPDGHAVAAWSLKIATVHRVQVRRYVPGSGWAPVETVLELTSNFTDPVLQLQAVNGNKAALYYELGDSYSALVFDGASWGNRIDLLGRGSEVALALGPAGHAALSWHTNSQLELRLFTPDAGWAVHSMARDGFVPRATALGPTGQVLVVGQKPEKLHAMRYDPAARTSTFEPLELTAQQVLIRIDPRGQPAMIVVEQPAPSAQTSSLWRLAIPWNGAHSGEKLEEVSGGVEMLRYQITPSAETVAWAGSFGGLWELSAQVKRREGDGPFGPALHQFGLMAFAHALEVTPRGAAISYTLGDGPVTYLRWFH
jgi:hypothetical protein